MRIKVCAIQMSPSPDIDKSIDKALSFLSMAAKNGANIVCFPELFLNTWFVQSKENGKVEENCKLAEQLDGKTINIMREYAARYRMVIIVPFFETHNGLYFNSAAVIDGSGEILGVYRKIHLPEIPNYYEKSYFSNGTEIPVFKTEFATIGIQMCWDNFYPEISRSLALKGANIIFAPTASAFNTNSKWFLSISANAFVNGVYMVRVNRVGKDGGLDFYGKSFYSAPDGSLVDDFAGLNECVLIYNIDTYEIEKARKVWPFLENRIGGIYNVL
jgi:N-carbamoylputrescine amidase